VAQDLGWDFSLVPRALELKMYLLSLIDEVFGQNVPFSSVLCFFLGVKKILLKVGQSNPAMNWMSKNCLR